MKRLLSILLVFVLIFAVSTVSFAKKRAFESTIGINFGYRHILTSTSQFNSATVGLFTTFTVSRFLEFSLKGDFTFGKGIKNINAQLFAKFLFPAFNRIDLGAQIGVIYDVLLETNGKSSFFFAPGIVGNFYATNTLGVVVDAKFPLFVFSPALGNTGFFKNFFYDVTVSGKYDLGITGPILQVNVGNSNSYKLETLSIGSKHIIDFNLGLGATFFPFGRII